MGRRVEPAKSSQLGSLGSDVRNFEKRPSRQLVLEACRPSLRIRRPRVLVHAEVTWKASGGGFREAILEGEYGLQAVRFVELVGYPVAQQVVGLDGDFRTVVDTVAYAKHGFIWQPRREPDPRSEVVVIRFQTSAHAPQHGSMWQRRVIQVEEIPAILAERCEVFVA